MIASFDIMPREGVQEESCANGSRISLSSITFYIHITGPGLPTSSAVQTGNVSGSSISGRRAISLVPPWQPPSVVAVVSMSALMCAVLCTIRGCSVPAMEDHY